MQSESTVAARIRAQLFDFLQTEEKKVRTKLQSMKYTMLETRKDGTKFTNKALKEAAAELQSIAREYDTKQQQLVDEVWRFSWQDKPSHQGFGCTALGLDLV